MARRGRPAHPNPPARQKIVKAAIRLMLVGGYPATSVDDVCAAAAVSKGTFFHYFGSKEDLGAAVLDAYLGGVLAHFEALRAAERDPKARVRGCVAFLSDAAVDGPIRHGCILGGFAQDISRSHPDLRRRCAAAFEQLIDLLAQDLAAGGAGAEAREQAEYVVAAFEGALLLARARQDPAVVRRTLDRVAVSLGLEPAVPRGSGASEARRPRTRRG